MLGPVPEHLRVGKDWAVRGPSAGASLGVGWSAPLSAAPRISPHLTATFGVSKLNFPDGVAPYTDPGTAKLRYFSLDLGAMAQVAQTRVAGRRVDLTLGGGILTAFVQMSYESALIDARSDTLQSSGYIRAKLDIPLFKGASGAKGFADLSLYGNKSADIRFGIDFQM
ncbi:hypothetical protein [Tropicibacter naphthalenivorans]|uniref:hypothetical protein n=1 Tax=Tropicibacter naphthalenivorans TaxID=441103 RepID=UPI001181462F|nr:hypothetical protein [Tropicibacter naphthalenivorans]